MGTACHSMPAPCGECDHCRSMEETKKIPIKNITKIVEIKKAGVVGDSAPVDVHVKISGVMPEFHAVAGIEFEDWEKKVKAFYKEQAGLLFDALVNSLPGGTVGQLTVRLLDHYSGLLRVPL